MRRFIGMAGVLSLALGACSAESGGSSTATGGGGGGGVGGGSGSAGTGAGGSGGVSSGGSGGFAIDAGLDDGAVDAPSCPDGGIPGEPGCDCGKLEFAIDTKQSCALSILPGFAMDGEGFIQLAGQNHRVFAMDRWGKGHVVAWCDSTTIPELLSAFDVRGYLGQVDQAKVASFGDDYLCQPGKIPSQALPSWIQYLGPDLPAQYQGNAALLAQDYDVVLFCGFRIPWATDWSQEIGEFVSVHGKGFLAAMDYEGVVEQQDFDNMSKITQAAGIVFEPLNLAWAPSSTSVSIECVPDLPPPPR